jgi:uncharacterized protein
MDISFDQVNELINKISKDIKKVEYKPDIIVAIGSGGLIPAKLIKKNFDVPIINLGIMYYNDDKKLIKEPIIYQDITKEQINNKNILLIDEIDDSRSTLKFALQKLNNMKPNDILVSVLHNKKRDKVHVIKEKYIYGKDVENIWINYPWE